MHKPYDNRPSDTGATGATSIGTALEAVLPHCRAIAGLLRPANADSDALVAGFLEDVRNSSGPEGHFPLVTRSDLEQRFLDYLDGVNGGRIHSVYLPIEGETSVIARMPLDNLLALLK